MADRELQSTRLLCVCGLTPQVVTETVFALAQHGREELPTEIHVVSTLEGARQAELSLLSGMPGWLERLRQDYALPPITFTPDQIHVLRSRSGQALADIRTAEDNQAAADQITDLVRGLTADPHHRLHVSLAGGRKTLGFFAGYALSLFGRPHDRLSHVLVSAPFESSPDFFYPTPHETIIHTRGGYADCAKAEVTLADIPFVRMRHGLPEALHQAAGFAQAIEAAQERLGPPQLMLRLAKQMVVAGGQEITLPPAELAFLAWFARRSQRAQDPIAAPKEGVPEQDYAREYLEEYRRIRGMIDNDGRTQARYATGMTKADFEERKSKLKRELQRRLGTALAAPYEIAAVGQRPRTRFHLALPADAIRFE